MPDCFLRYRISASARNFTSGKSRGIRIGGPPLQRGVVLEWFYSLSRRNRPNFVGGTCALPSALLLCNTRTTVSLASQRAIHCIALPVHRETTEISPFLYEIGTYVTGYTKIRNGTTERSVIGQCNRRASVIGCQK